MGGRIGSFIWDLSSPSTLLFGLLKYFSSDESLVSIHGGGGCGGRLIAGWLAGWDTKGADDLVVVLSATACIYRKEGRDALLYEMR